MGTCTTRTVASTITSTYGYNGYYLSPAKTPGWGERILEPAVEALLGEMGRDTEVFVFADALLPGSTPSNTALLDPPHLFTRGSGWQTNSSPTTAFRHGRRRRLARLAGRVAPSPPEPTGVFGRSRLRKARS